MQRQYYISDSLDRIETVSTALEGAGIDRMQIHVLSLDDDGVGRRLALHGVASIMKKDLLMSGVRGAIVGAVVAIAVLVVAGLLNAFASPVGQAITLFAALAAFGFCTWEGGFYGIQTLNKKMARFEQTLREGKHVLFVDTDNQQAFDLTRVMTNFSDVEPAGTTRGLPRWVVVGQRELPRFLTETLP